MIHRVDLQEEEESGSEESEPVPAASTIMATAKSDPPLHGAEKLAVASGAAAAAAPAPVAPVAATVQASRPSPPPVLDPGVVRTSFISAPPRVEEIRKGHSGDENRALAPASAGTTSTGRAVEGRSLGDTSNLDQLHIFTMLFCFKCPPARRCEFIVINPQSM